MSNIFKTFALVSVLCLSVGNAFAAKKSARYTESESSPSRSGSANAYEMLIDLTASYVRDTKADGQTDTAGKISVGGMILPWVGLDFQALYKAKSKSYLVGTDIRIVPIDWFFIKGGVGGYSNKATNELSLSPLFSTGILVRMSDDYYFLTEVSTFNVNDRNNVAFGAGLGARF